MKSPDPSEHNRSYTGDEPGPIRSEERLDREHDDPYRDFSSRSKHRSGARNLLLGVVLVAIAGAVFIKALMLTGAKAGPPLAAALVTLLALFVLARARLFHQRNGGFVALGIVLLLATLLPLGEYALTHVPVPTPNQAAQGAPSSPPPGASESAATPQEPELPLLSSAYPVGQANDQAARFKVLRDLRVEMGDGKAYMIKEGEVLPMADSAPGEVHFLAGDQKIALPADTVEMMPPAGATAPGAVAGTPGGVPGIPGQPAATAPGTVPPGTQAERPAQITERAQKEAIRRYPALGQIDSPENKLFRDTYAEMKKAGADDFFRDPGWPLQLAELLARREKWQRQP